MVASAYICQFIWTHAPFETGKIWRAHEEPKCKLFAWLLAHGKIGTQTHQETVQHIFHECPFTKGVRDSVLASCDLPVPSAVSTMDRDFDGWWLQFIATFWKEKQRTSTRIIHMGDLEGAKHKGLHKCCASIEWCGAPWARCDPAEGSCLHWWPSRPRLPSCVFFFSF
jgi:hypothetical protein